MPKHDAGAQLFKRLYQDFAGTCAGECGYGSYWACLGRYSAWPVASSTTVTQTWWVYDLTAGAGVPTADVQICTSCPCDAGASAVLAHVQTDDAGYFTATYPNHISATGVGGFPCVEVSSVGYVTNSAYAAFPFTESTISMKDALQAPTAWGIPLLKTADLQLRASLVYGALDPALGVVSARTWDCLSSPAIGVDVSIATATPDSGVWPPLDAGLDAGLTGQTISNGNLSALVTFFNIPPNALGIGATTLTSSLPGRPGHVAQGSVTVQPNVTCGIQLTPTP
jgi:hypothetical protein